MNSINSNQFQIHFGLAEGEWLNTQEAEVLSRLKKSQLWNLAKEGEIKSFSARAHKYSKRGKRYFSRSSILAYLDRKAREWDKRTQETSV